MANETSSNGLSGYTRIIQTILTTSGPVALLALLLAGFLMWTVKDDLKNLNAGIQLNYKEIQEAKISMHSFVAVQIELEKVRTEQMQLLVKISQQSCLNGARTEIAVKGCLGER